MQQQTTVLSTSHGSYLSPGVAFSPCHIQQIGAVSLNGLPAAPIAQTSGEGGAWRGCRSHCDPQQPRGDGVGRCGRFAGLGLRCPHREPRQQPMLPLVVPQPRAAPSPAGRRERSSVPCSPTWRMGGGLCRASSHSISVLLCRAALTASAGNDGHAGPGGSHLQRLHWRGALSQRPPGLGNGVHQRLRAVFRYGTREETTCGPEELLLALYSSIPAAKASPAPLAGSVQSVCAVPFAVLLMLFFFAAQSPSVAETLHPAFSGVQQYAGTALPSLPPSSLRPTAPGKRFVLSPRITAVYPTTSITPIAQSIPQPPPVLQQQQREGEDGRLWGSRGEQLSPRDGMWGSPRGFQLCGS